MMKNPPTLEEKINQIKTSKLSAYGKKKAIRRLKKESGDDLTITY